MVLCGGVDILDRWGSGSFGVTCAIEIINPLNPQPNCDWFPPRFVAGTDQSTCEFERFFLGCISYGLSVTPVPSDRTKRGGGAGTL